MHFKSTYILSFFLCLFGVQTLVSQDIKPKVKPILRDTINPKKIDSIKTIKKDSLLLKSVDTTALDSIKPKEAIEDIITHTAKDYTIQDAKNKTVTLYNEAHVTYTDIDLKAGIIIVDYNKNTLYAKGIKDSLGYQQRPVFKQGSQESEQDSILYNFKSKQALIYGLKTSQGEIITYGEKTKRVNDSTIYVRKIRFTTSQKENPDYYIATNKAKLVPGKKIIVGTSNLVLADVPTPIILPFAYFPLTEESVSGIIIPSWNDSSSRGFSLQNGGYYFAINDYVDLAVTGDVYTNGGWAIRFDSNYIVRYKFNGTFSFNYENNIQSFKGFDDFSKSTNYNIRWNYNQAQKANPNSRFSANVNLGSSRYYRESLNEINNSQFLTNTLNSSISYYKKFVGTPFNLTTSINHSQNTNTQIINMTLPNVRLDMDRIFPFAGKGGVKKNPIQRLGFNYVMQGEYNISTTDSLFFKPEMFETAKAGIRQSTGTSTSLKIAKHFTLSPSVNFTESWNFNYIEKRFDPTIVNNSGTLGEVVTDSINGFKSFREYNAGINLSTNIYGDFNINRGRLKKIRHTFRPSISYGYRPDFSKIFFDKVQTNIAGTEFETYSPFTNSLYSNVSASLSSSIGISLNNVVEAKIAPKDPDSDEEDKKIFILNNLNFSSSYNIAADSLRWSPVSVSAGTRFLKDKLTVNLSGSLDPYQITEDGVRIDKFNDGIFRLTNANVTANYAFSSKDFQRKEDEESTVAGDTPDVLGANIDPTNRFAQGRNPNANNNTNQNQKENVEAELYNADIPWTVNLAYAANYSNNGFSTSGIQSHSIMFNGNLELSPKWTVGYSSGYDIKSGAFTYSRFNFARDLDSWQFNFNWVPFGSNSSYTFFIGVKSAVLRDLKFDKNNPPDRRLF